MTHIPFSRWLGYLWYFVLLMILSACKPGSVIVPTLDSSPCETQTSSFPPTALPPKITPTASIPTIESTNTIVETQPSVSSPPPVPPAFPVVGIEMHRIDQSGGLDLVKQSGAYWVRRNALLWSEVEPEEGNRDWDAITALESELQNAADQDLEVILIVRSTPKWAQKLPGIFCGPVRPDKLSVFADFMYDLVSRYSVPPYNVKYWEFGNEPDIDPVYVSPDNIFGCWGDLNDDYYGGGYYAEMLKAIYPEIKAADPQAQVLVGGLAIYCDPVNPPEIPSGSGQYLDCTPARFLEGILENNGGDYFDGVSFHTYDYYSGKLGQYGNENWLSAWNTSGPVLTVKSRYLQSLLALYGYSGKYLMNTESAIICGSDGSEPACRTEDFALTKAYYAAQANAVARAEGLRANVWYSITGWRASELVDRSSMQPLPVYYALQFSASQLNGSTYVREIVMYPGVRGYEFDQYGERKWILWSLDGEEHLIQLTSEPKAILDVFGEDFPIGQELTITVAPVYLEWDP